MDKTYIDIMKEMDDCFHLIEIIGLGNHIADRLQETQKLAEELGVEVRQILKLIKYFTKYTAVQFEESLYLSKEFFIRGFVIDECASFLLTENALFIIPRKDNEPTRVIKRIK